MQHARLVEKRQVRHVLGLFELGRIDFLRLILVDFLQNGKLLVAAERARVETSPRGEARGTNRLSFLRLYGDNVAANGLGFGDDEALFRIRYPHVGLVVELARGLLLQEKKLGDGGRRQGR